jgi:hypothetical protein
MLPSDQHNSSEPAQKTRVLISVLTLGNASPVLDPSDLILTRGTLDEEDEEADSDTDDIDHRGERQPVDIAAAPSTQEIVTVERRS